MSLYYAKLSSFHIYTSSNSGVTWTAQTSVLAFIGSWNSCYIASSSDGTRLVAATYPGQIYTSVNSGVTWTQRTSDPTVAWSSVASSADGAKLVAGTMTQGTYTSSDLGLSWTASGPAVQHAGFPSVVASSADGTKLAAACQRDQIYTAALSSTTGTAGYLQGFQGSAIELQYIGNGQFMPLSHEGIFSVH